MNKTIKSFRVNFQITKKLLKSFQDMVHLKFSKKNGTTPILIRKKKNVISKSQLEHKFPKH